MCPQEPYVARLRKIVGQERLLLPAVSVLPWDSQGRLLMVFQSDYEKWSIIGGSVEIGESPAEAAVREVLEETGLAIELGPVRAAVGGPSYDVEYPNGDRCSYVSVVYDARPIGGQVAADGDETTAVRWVVLAELRTMEITPYARSLFFELGLLEMRGSDACS